MTVDGWSVAVDRLLLGIGHASLAFSRNCIRYSDSGYMRLLDARLPKEQKLSLLHGFGQCYVEFFVRPPDPDTLLGEGVSEMDKTSMMGTQDRPSAPPLGSIAIDFAATATRGGETKQLRWGFRHTIPYFKCASTAGGVPPQPIELRSDEDLTFHAIIRAAAFFGDDNSATTAMPRFDPIAAADTTFGNDDGDITLDELGEVSIDVARQSGAYGTGHLGTRPRSLEDYMYLVLLPQLVGFREEIACSPTFTPPPP
jgi:hypothetical protein